MLRDGQDGDDEQDVAQTVCRRDVGRDVGGSRRDGGGEKGTENRK